MRVALFSPLPPSKSGIADYTAALAEPLASIVTLDAFGGPPAGFDASAYDTLVYQIGNNVHHAFAYEMALEHPGVVVLHEANLHHLVAETTIRRGDWDAYLAEVAFDGGAEALAFARRVRALEVGPDYDGVAMLRRLAGRSRAFIVHSRAVEQELRRVGFRGPVAVIPHGAWTADGDRMGYRRRLDLDETTPLAGIFGFLKPYKRIAESLRAFRRLTRLEPRAKLILVGEPHPDLPLRPLIARLGLEAHVRLLGFVGIEDFSGLMSACDIVLNLRYPTVGESSGSLVRALGLGRAVVVSDVGSFRELPDDIVLKTPVDAGEEDCLFEYLNLLVSRPELGRAFGARARAWVERECGWPLVAQRYASFLDAVVRGVEWRQPEAVTRAVHVQAEAPKVEPETIENWAAGAGARDYIRDHLARLARTLEITPPGTSEDRILEMGSYLQITPALKSKLGYGEVRGCYYGPAGRVESREVVSAEGYRFACEIDLFDAERDRFPYPDGHFRTVLCCELIEHLAEDPMHMMAEINRVLVPDGCLVLTTPNITSLRALRAILEGFHPGFFPAYIRPRKEGEEAEARHNREYSPKEIARLLSDAGFEVERLETGPFQDEARPEHAWVTHLLERYLLPAELRGDDIFAVGRKRGPVRERHPAWLYQ